MKWFKSINWRQFFCIHGLYGSRKVKTNRDGVSPWHYSRYCNRCDKKVYSGI